MREKDPWVELARHKTHRRRVWKMVILVLVYVALIFVILVAMR